MTNPTLAATVSRILRHPEISKIAFKLNGLQVDAAGFADVANAIDAKRIECQNVAEFDKQRATAAGTVVEARYSIKGDAMLFPNPSYGSTASEECTIVHEAVHAMFDLRTAGKAQSNLAIDDEAAAVLAEALYVILCKSTGGKMIPVNYRMVVESPQDEGWQVANNMVLSGKPMTAGNPYVLDQLEIQALKNSVASTYKLNKYIDKQGIKSDDSGLRYIYDGVPICGRPAKRK